MALTAAAVPALASAQQQQQTPARPAATFNIRDFGALGDGKAIDSPAINAAITAAADAGGGTVVFPAGAYLSFSIRLRSKVPVEIVPKAPDARPAIYTEDVHRADFAFITAPKTPAAFSLNETTDTRILLSRAAPDSVIP